MNQRARHSRISTWRKALNFLVVGAIVCAIASYFGWWIAGTLFLLFSLLMAWWVSPIRKGAHTPWLTALMKRAPNHAIIVWSPVDRGSSQLGIGIQPSDPRTTWVNYFQDAEAAAFVKQHGGFDALPVAVVGDAILTHATSGQVIDAMTDTARSDD